MLKGNRKAVQSKICEIRRTMERAVWLGDVFLQTTKGLHRASETYKVDAKVDDAMLKQWQFPVELDIGYRDAQTLGLRSLKECTERRS